MRRSKAALLGLSALALLAMSAFAASSAQGDPEEANHDGTYNTHKVTTSEHKFLCLKEENHNEIQPNCTGHGEDVPTHRKHNNAITNEHVFTSPSGEVECETTTFDVDFVKSGESPTSPTTPTYENCTIGGAPAEVKHNECKYTFYVEDTVVTENPPAGYEETEGKGSTTIDCPTGKAITVTGEPGFGECHIEVRPQATITPIYFRNNNTGSRTDITVEAHTATTIIHTEGGFFACGVLNGEHHSTYTGNTTVRGQIENPSKPPDHIFVEARFDDGKEHDPLNTPTETT